MTLHAHLLKVLHQSSPQSSFSPSYLPLSPDTPSSTQHMEETTPRMNHPSTTIPPGRVSAHFAPRLLRLSARRGQAASAHPLGTIGALKRINFFSFEFGFSDMRSSSGTGLCLGMVSTLRVALAHDPLDTAPTAPPHGLVTHEKSSKSVSGLRVTRGAALGGSGRREGSYQSELMPGAWMDECVEEPVLSTTKPATARQRQQGLALTGSLGEVLAEMFPTPWRVGRPVLCSLPAWPPREPQGRRYPLRRMTAAAVRVVPEGCHASGPGADPEDHGDPLSTRASPEASSIEFQAICPGREGQRCLACSHACQCRGSNRARLRCHTKALSSSHA